MKPVELEPEKRYRPGNAVPFAEWGPPATHSRALRQMHLHRRQLLVGAATAFFGYVVLSAVLVAGGLVITHLLEHSVGAWDEHVNAWFAHHRDSAGNTITADFTFLADTLGITVVATAVVLLVLVSRRARLAVMLIVGLATELTVFLTVNYVVGRPRPRVPHLGSTPSTFSWPSGHVAVTLVLYGGIALIVAAFTTRRLPRVAAWLFVVCLVVCVAVSRVYRGDHHPTDALAGVLLGAGALWVASRTVAVCAIALGWGS